MGTELNREGDGPDGNEETQPGHADHSHVWNFNHCTFMDNLSHLLDDKIIPYSKRGNVCGKSAVIFQCNNL